MKPEYEKLTEKVMDWVGQAAQQIGDFATKEIPPFITEYLGWKFWECIIHIVGYITVEALLVIITIVMFKVANFGWKKYKEGHNDYDLLSIGGTVVGAVFIIISLVHLFGNFPTQNLLDCVQIKIAPKVYLVEKASTIYKAAK